MRTELVSKFLYTFVYFCFVLFLVIFRYEELYPGIIWSYDMRCMQIKTQHSRCTKDGVLFNDWENVVNGTTDFYIHGRETGKLRKKMMRVIFKFL